MQFCELFFTIRFIDAGHLPTYRGTTIRGAFGYALKKIVCIAGRKDCSQCLLKDRCAFPVVFEGRPPADRLIMRKYPQIPQPFVLRVAFSENPTVQPGDEYDFGIRLFGPAMEFYPYVIYTVMRMGEAGLGRDRLRFDVRRVSDGQNDLLHGADLAAPVSRDLLSKGSHTDSRPVRIRLDFETPLRLQTGGELNRAPSVSDLVRASIRRIRILSHFYGEQEIIPDDITALMTSCEGAQLMEASTRWHEIKRRSTRQGTDMNLSGLIGQLDYRLPDQRLLPWLKAASWCHVGKATSFGYGRLKVSWEDA